MDSPLLNAMDWVQVLTKFHFLLGICVYWNSLNGILRRRRREFDPEHFLQSHRK